MHRVTYHMTERQHERLRALSERTGLSVAELIRRAVDAMTERDARRNTEKDKS